MVHPMVQEHACSDSGRDKGCPKGKQSGRERNMIIVGSSRVRTSPVVGFTVVSKRTLDIQHMEKSNHRQRGYGCFKLRVTAEKANTMHRSAKDIKYCGEGKRVPVAFEY
jgi:hypothetical protein